jgi:hypothetical protein
VLARGGQGLLRVRTLEQWWTRGVMGKVRDEQGVLWVRAEVDMMCYGYGQRPNGGVMGKARCGH